MIYVIPKWVEVKNRKGSGDEEPPAGFDSWKEFWEEESEETFDQCACKGCNNGATDGAHVIKVDSKDKKSYIVPLCHRCNKKPVSESFEVPREWLVPVSDG